MVQRSKVQFDQFTIVLLVRRPDAPKLDEKVEDALQDAHLAHLAKLHDEGWLLAAGPLEGPPDRDLRGLCIFKTDLEKTRELEEQDPSVKAGTLAVKVMRWNVPRGAMAFSHTRLPRSIVDVTGG